MPSQRANIDPAMEQAAANLGCTGFAKFRKITLPLIMPGLFAGVCTFALPTPSMLTS